jgi:UDPglucose--hexose-1-phosphate uridylyltransferase
LKHAQATEYFDRTGDCLYGVLLQEELLAGTRIVTENASFVAFVPYAAHVPFETWVVPKGLREPFHETSVHDLRALAEILQSVLRKLYADLENPDYNLSIDLPLRGDEDQSCFLWHLRILPRLSTPAGFELGSGMSINTVMPEDAVSFLRSGNGVN